MMMTTPNNTKNKKFTPIKRRVYSSWGRKTNDYDDDDDAVNEDNSTPIKTNVRTTTTPNDDDAAAAAAATPMSQVYLNFRQVRKELNHTYYCHSILNDDDDVHRRQIQLYVPPPTTTPIIPLSSAVSIASPQRQQCLVRMERQNGKNGTTGGGDGLVVVAAARQMNDDNDNSNNGSSPWRRDSSLKKIDGYIDEDFIFGGIYNKKMAKNKTSTLPTNFDGELFYDSSHDGDGNSSTQYYDGEEENEEEEVGYDNYLRHVGYHQYDDQDDNIVVQQEQQHLHHHHRENYIASYEFDNSIDLQPSEDEVLYEYDNNIVEDYGDDEEEEKDNDEVFDNDELATRIMTLISSQQPPPPQQQQQQVVQEEIQYDPSIIATITPEVATDTIMPIPIQIPLVLEENENLQIEHHQEQTTNDSDDDVGETENDEEHDNDAVVGDGRSNNIDNNSEDNVVFDNYPIGDLTYDEGNNDDIDEDYNDNNNFTMGTQNDLPTTTTSSEVGVGVVEEDSYEAWLASQQQQPEAEHETPEEVHEEETPLEYSEDDEIEPDQDLKNNEDVIAETESLEKESEPDHGTQPGQGTSPIEEVSQDAMFTAPHPVDHETISSAVEEVELVEEEDQTETDDSYERWLASQMKHDDTDGPVVEDVIPFDDEVDGDQPVNEQEKDSEPSPVEMTPEDTRLESEQIPPPETHGSEYSETGSLPQTDNLEFSSPQSELHPSNAEVTTATSTLQLLANVAKSLAPSFDTNDNIADLVDHDSVKDSTQRFQLAKEDSYESSPASKMEQVDHLEHVELADEAIKDEIRTGHDVLETSEISVKDDMVDVVPPSSLGASFPTSSIAQVSPNEHAQDTISSTSCEAYQIEKVVETSEPPEGHDPNPSASTEMERKEETDPQSHHDDSVTDGETIAEMEKAKVGLNPKLPSRRPKVPSPRHILWDESEIRFADDSLEYEETGNTSNQEQDSEKPHQAGMVDLDSGIVEDQTDDLEFDTGIRKPKVPTPTFMFSGGGRIAFHSDGHVAQHLPTAPSPVELLSVTDPTSIKDSKYPVAASNSGLVANEKNLEQGGTIGTSKPSVPSPQILPTQPNRPPFLRSVGKVSLVSDSTDGLSQKDSVEQHELDTDDDGEPSLLAVAMKLEPTEEAVVENKSEAMSPRKMLFGRVARGSASSESCETPEQQQVSGVEDKSTLGSDVKSQERDATWQSLAAQWDAKKASDPYLSESAKKKNMAGAFDSSRSSEEQSADDELSTVSSLSLSSGSRTEDDIQLESYPLLIPPLDGVATSNTSSSGTFNLSEESDALPRYVRSEGEDLNKLGATATEQSSAQQLTSTPDRKPSTPKFSNHPLVFPDKAPSLATEERAKSRRSEDGPSTPHRVESTRSTPRSKRDDVSTDSGVVLRTEERAKARASRIPSAQKAKSTTATPTRKAKTPPRPPVLADNAPDLETASRAKQRALNPVAGSSSPAAIPASVNLFPLEDRRLEMFRKRRQNSEDCKNMFEANLHKEVGACDRCWSLASPDDRAKYKKRGSNLNIMRTRSGCGPNCKIFPFFLPEEPVRLCLKCFLDTHQKRQKIQVYRGNHQKVLPIS